MNNMPDIGKMITDYVEQKQLSLHYHKKKSDAEKEYNKLLAVSGGEGKNFSLDEANRIYRAYNEMQLNEEQSRVAEEKFNEVDEKMKELGQILFHGTVTAEIILPAINGTPATSKFVTVSFPNGQVLVV